MNLDTWDDSRRLVAPASLLHRVFQETPGDASEFLCSRRGCEEGFDLFTIVYLSLMIPALLASHDFRCWWLLFTTLIVVFAFGATLHEPFAAWERLGRARRRRNECVWCGTPRGDGNDFCGGCGAGKGCEGSAHWPEGSCQVPRRRYESS